MITVPEAFSTSYKEARAKFLQAAAAAGLKLQSYPHPLKGAEGEDLALDVAYQGPENAEALLLASSGCHGIEGYCGSGVQVFALADAEWHARVAERGIGVLYVHGLNPHGFSHKRRVTNENVDLNRNFQDFNAPLPPNPGYAELHDLLLPDYWPPSEAHEAKVHAYVAEHGRPTYQANVTTGQHTHPDGLFFGGTAPTWSNLTVRQVMRDWVRGRKRLAWIDFHTGLGPSGHGERIHATPMPDDASLLRARAWWGGNGETPITSIYDGSSTSAAIRGMMPAAALEECPDTETTAIAMEYGTVPVLNVLDALRGDHWAERERMQGRHVDAALQAQITQACSDAFYTQTDLWKGQILSQGRQSMFQAADGLAGVL